jgi:hypothetical protein
MPPTLPVATPHGQPGKAADRARHHMKCKNQNCDSIQVYEVDIPPNRNGGRHVYECCKCHTTWGVPTGGSVEF